MFKTTVTIHEIPHSRYTGINDLREYHKIEYSSIVRLVYRILALLFLLGPSVIYYYSKEQFSLIAIIIGVLLALIMLYISHNNEMKTGFIVSNEGIKGRSIDLKWADVSNVQLVKISTPSSRSPNTYIRITEKSENYFDFSIDEVSITQDDVAMLVKSYFQRYLKTVANNAYPQAGSAEHLIK